MTLAENLDSVQEALEFASQENPNYRDREIEIAFNRAKEIVNNVSFFVIDRTGLGVLYKNNVIRNNAESRILIKDFLNDMKLYSYLILDISTGDLTFNSSSNLLTINTNQHSATDVLRYIENAKHATLRAIQLRYDTFSAWRTMNQSDRREIISNRYDYPRIGEVREENLSIEKFKDLFKKEIQEESFGKKIYLNSSDQRSLFISTDEEGADVLFGNQLSRLLAFCVGDNLLNFFKTIPDIERGYPKVLNQEVFRRIKRSVDVINGFLIQIADEKRKQKEMIKIEEFKKILPKVKFWSATKNAKRVRIYIDGKLVRDKSIVDKILCAIDMESEALKPFLSGFFKSNRDGLAERLNKALDDKLSQLKIDKSEPNIDIRRGRRLKIVKNQLKLSNQYIAKTKSIRRKFCYQKYPSRCRM
jgi:hypothetical protein